jgi:hypothetical protein
MTAVNVSITETLPSRPIAPTVIPQFHRRLTVTSAEPAELVFRSSWPRPAAREPRAATWFPVIPLLASYAFDVAGGRRLPVH